MTVSDEVTGILIDMKDANIEYRGKVISLPTAPDVVQLRYIKRRIDEKIAEFKGPASEEK